jgi:hypothetical protein
MPCPLFEPIRRVDHEDSWNARLPLLFEFEGICHGGEEAIDEERRFRFCNRGYARSYCKSFPTHVENSAIRFSVVEATAATVTVLVIEEEDHWPKRWTKTEFVIAEARLEPEIEDGCRRAQTIQFCLSYLDKTKNGKT